MSIQVSYNGYSKTVTFNNDVEGAFMFAASLNPELPVDIWVDDRLTFTYQKDENTITTEYHDHANGVIQLYTVSLV